MKMIARMITLMTNTDMMIARMVTLMKNIQT